MSLIPNIRYLGLRVVAGNKSKSLRNFLAPLQLIHASSANINSKATRVDWPKPAPWPFEKKGYKSWRSWYEGTLKRFDENTKVIVIDGPPGVGKDDLGRHLADEFDMRFYPAPTMDLFYINAYGFDFRTYDEKLPKTVRSYDEKSFLQNPRDKYKRLLQMEIHLLRLAYSQYVDALAHLFNSGQGVVLTAHPYSHFSFADACQKVGYLDKKEFGAYLRHRDETIGKLLRPHLVIYLDCPVSGVTEKLKRRGQGEEKALTPEFLKALEESYKTKFLQNIEANCEVLVYDWSEPGDLEIVVEDIERINFEEIREPRHPMFKDWDFINDTAACEQRWIFTERKSIIMSDFCIPIFDVPSLMGDPDDWDKWWTLFYDAPGNKFEYGYDPGFGDKVLWKGLKPAYPFVNKRTAVF